jgi:hypothetical protein
MLGSRMPISCRRPLLENSLLTEISVMEGHLCGAAHRAAGSVRIHWRDTLSWAQPLTPYPTHEP